MSERFRKVCREGFLAKICSNFKVYFTSLKRASLTKERTQGMGHNKRAFVLCPSYDFFCLSFLLSFTISCYSYTVKPDVDEISSTIIQVSLFSDSVIQVYPAICQEASKCDCSGYRSMCGSCNERGPAAGCFLQSLCIVQRFHLLYGRLTHKGIGHSTCRLRLDSQGVWN